VGAAVTRQAVHVVALLVLGPDLRSKSGDPGSDGLAGSLDALALGIELATAVRMRVATGVSGGRRLTWRSPEECERSIVG